MITTRTKNKWFTRYVFLRSWTVTLLSVLNRTKALDTN